MEMSVSLQTFTTRLEPRYQTQLLNLFLSYYSFPVLFPYSADLNFSCFRLSLFSFFYLRFSLAAFVILSFLNQFPSLRSCIAPHLLHFDFLPYIIFLFHSLISISLPPFQHSAFCFLSLFPPYSVHFLAISHHFRFSSPSIIPSFSPSSPFSTI